MTDKVTTPPPPITRWFLGSDDQATLAPLNEAISGGASTTVFIDSGKNLKDSDVLLGYVRSAECTDRYRIVWGENAFSVQGAPCDGILLSQNIKRESVTPEIFDSFIGTLSKYDHVITNNPAQNWADILPFVQNHLDTFRLLLDPVYLPMRNVWTSVEQIPEDRRKEGNQWVQSTGSKLEEKTVHAFMDHHPLRSIPKEDAPMWQLSFSVIQTIEEDLDAITNQLLKIDTVRTEGEKNGATEETVRAVIENLNPAENPLNNIPVLFAHRYPYIPAKQMVQMRTLCSQWIVARFLYRARKSAKSDETTPGPIAIQTENQKTEEGRKNRIQDQIRLVISTPGMREEDLRLVEALFVAHGFLAEAETEKIFGGPRTEAEVATTIQSLKTTFASNLLFPLLVEIESDKKQTEEARGRAKKLKGNLDDYSSLNNFLTGLDLSDATATAEEPPASVKAAKETQSPWGEVLVSMGLSALCFGAGYGISRVGNRNNEDKSLMVGRNLAFSCAGGFAVNGAVAPLHNGSWAGRIPAFVAGGVGGWFIGASFPFPQGVDTPPSSVVGISGTVPSNHATIAERDIGVVAPPIVRNPGSDVGY